MIKHLVWISRVWVKKNRLIFKAACVVEQEATAQLKNSIILQLDA